VRPAAPVAIAGGGDVHRCRGRTPRNPFGSRAGVWGASMVACSSHRPSR
jgi:hypothetical protein